MIRRNPLIAAALAACMTLVPASLALAHGSGPGYGGGNPYGWHYGWHHGGGMGPMMGPMMGGQGMMMQGCPMAPGYGMGGYGMMGPGMMGPGMMGPGMMGPGYGPEGGEMPMMGPGGQGHGMGPGMGQGMGPGTGPGTGQGMAPGMGQGMGPGMIPPTARTLSADDVKTMLERRLAWQGNPHVKLGEVAEKDDDTIVAEIVTQDGSLVQRLEVDRHRGWTRTVR
ncbi:hypothetical protein [Pelagibius marinus]|uniref:hypothetical protein n=1 Tax=Pelagibius marinus TaxID=2762760 RepID=UPI00187259BE|nr:hypothetical protein [Pelagibius marinus]